MGKAGGIIGIVAGVLGVFAAFVTYFIGFVGFAVEPMEGITVMGYALRGLGFALLAIIFGCTALVLPRSGGLGLVLVSIGGAIFGSQLVAMCMSLSLVGGILAVWNRKKPAAAPAAIVNAS